MAKKDLGKDETGLTRSETESLYHTRACIVTFFMCICAALYKDLPPHFFKTELLPFFHTARIHFYPSFFLMSSIVELIFSKLLQTSRVVYVQTVTFISDKYRLKVSVLSL